MYKTAIAMVCLAAGTATAQWTTVDMEDLTLAEEFYNAGDGAGGFVSHQVQFVTNYHTGGWEWWEGFALSRVQDNTTPGFGNQYASFALGGFGGDGNYAVAYDAGNGAKLNLPGATTVRGALFTNTTWAGLFMQDGDAVFGKDPYGPNDWMILTVTGYDALGQETKAVTFDLADFSNPYADPTVVSEWTWLNLQPLGDNVASLGFSVSTNRPFTPTYFALDNLVYDSTNIPEPASLGLLTAGGLVLLGRKRR
jgi:hypothetical protein